METIIYLEWSYTPANYFEESRYEKREGFRLEINSGKVRAILDETGNELDFFDKVQEEIENYFHAIEIVTHKEYSLSSYTLYKEYPDGRKDTNVFTKPARLLITGYAPDIQITKADGTVIQDTKRERLAEEKLLAELFGKFRSKDKTVQKIVKSYDSAVKDPPNEFVHLYEIRDSFMERFGGKKRSQASLGISEAEWETFDALANNPQLRESRHRGKSLGPVRNATSAELTMARKFTRRMIIEYLKRLDKGEVEPVI